MNKVIIIEDEVYLRRGIACTVDWEAHQCILIGEFDNPQQVFDQLPGLMPDIIITDIRMPGMTGLDMIKKLLGKGMDCAFIIISGFDDFQYAKTALDLGVVGYLLKPIDDDELQEALVRAIGALEQRRKLQHIQNNQTFELTGSASLFLDLEHRSLAGFKDHLVEKALLLIRENYMHEYTVNQLAKELNISESSLFKLFKSKTGYAASEWLTYYRISKAIALMRENGLRVYEAAEQVGYKDVRYFSSLFKKYTGVKPSDFLN